MLNTLTTYLAGNENLKRVINSPCLDHHGKMLSRDGQKVFTANNNNRRGGNRFNKKGRGNQQRKGSGKNQKGKNKGSGNQVFNLWVKFILILKISEAW